MTAMTGMTSRGIAAVDVSVDGSPLPEELTRRLVSVRVSSRLSAPAQCELAFATWRGSAAEHDRAPLGAAVTVRVDGDTEPLFDGEVTCFELVHDPDGHAQTRIRCYDKLHRLRKRQQLRVFEDVTAVGLAEELTSDLGIGVGADDEGPRWERVVQFRQRDFELLNEVANRAGLYPVLHGDELRLVTLEGHGDAVELELGRNLLQARVEANLDRVSRSCTAFGWDTRTAEVIEETAGSARSGREIQLDPDPGDVGVDGELMLVDQPGRSADEVAAVAQAALDAAAGRAVTISGVAEGDARLRAGGLIDVRGLADPVRGQYVLTEVVHTVDATGYLTTFDTEPPPITTTSQGFSPITLGRVTDVDDPDNLGRVKVTLPAHGDADVGWLGVVFPGAGRDKGIVALPDVDDTVLVALPHGSPVGGLVVGSLYGGVEPFDPGVEGGAVKRWSLRTPDGQAITIDDAEHRITLRNKDGSYVRLAPDLVSVHAATDLTLQAPGHAMKLRAKSVDFEYAPEPEEGEA
jgi:uncharacterized protein involved in type VI secretion and phage assembly